MSEVITIKLERTYAENQRYSKVIMQPLTPEEASDMALLQRLVAEILDELPRLMEATRAQDPKPAFLCR